MLKTFKSNGKTYKKYSSRLMMNLSILIFNETCARIKHTLIPLRLTNEENKLLKKLEKKRKKLKIDKAFPGTEDKFH